MAKEPEFKGKKVDFFFAWKWLVTFGIFENFFLQADQVIFGDNGFWAMQIFDFIAFTLTVFLEQPKNAAGKRSYRVNQAYSGLVIAEYAAQSLLIFAHLGLTQVWPKS